MKPTRITSASCKKIKGIISNSLTRKVLATCFAILVLASCSQDNGKYHFLTSGEAISSAQSFLTTLRKSPSGDIKRIAEKVGEWQALRDSVFACLCRDTASIPHSSYNQAFRLISDSVRREFVAHAGAKQRTFLDLIVLKLQTSPYRDDAELATSFKEAAPFFARLDSMTLNKSLKSGDVLLPYRNFLCTTLQNGIHSKSQLLDFIRKEDFHFRCFMRVLPQYAASERLKEITSLTEDCCTAIMQSAGRKEISYKDATVYLTLRTNRRLIQNAQTAIADIESGKVKDEKVAPAYVMMLLQPYMVIEGVQACALTEADKTNLYDIARKIPLALRKLNKGNGLDTERLSRLPDLLIKIYLLRI